MPRACETVALKSLHERFARVGTIKYATPEEAKFLVASGMAAEVPAQAKEYLHREMRATGSRKSR